MIEYKQIEVVRKEPVSITCDICKKTFDVKKDIIEAQEFFQIKETVGYGSIFGDSNTVTIDICQHCLKEKLGEFLTYERNPLPSGRGQSLD